MSSTIEDYTKITVKNISNRRLRSWLTMIGIFIGIASVVSLIGLGQGLRIAITSQFGLLGTDILTVQASGLNFAGPPGSGVVDPLSDDLPKKFERIKGVEASFSRYIESGRIEFNDQQDITFIGSIPEGENRKFFEKMVNLKMDQGRSLKDGETKKVLMGFDYSTDEEFGRPVAAGSRIKIDGVTYEVIGIIEKKGSFIFDSAVYMNENEMIDIFNIKDETNAIAIKVFNEDDIPRIKESVEKLLRKERDVKIGEENFIVQTPQAALASLDSTLFAIQLFVSIISGVSLLVGGIGIMNTMYTSVLERTKEIGIMKAIGAKNSTVFTLFFMESGFLGLVGGLIGIALGSGLAFGLSALGRQALGSDLIQASIGLPLIISSLLFSFVLGTFFGVLPAYQASKLHPVDALRSK